jgi:hypothetical protein
MAELAALLDAEVGETGVGDGVVLWKGLLIFYLFFIIC